MDKIRGKETEDLIRLKILCVHFKRFKVSRTGDLNPGYRHRQTKKLRERWKKVGNSGNKWKITEKKRKNNRGNSKEIA